MGPLTLSPKQGKVHTSLAYPHRLSHAHLLTPAGLKSTDISDAENSDALGCLMSVSSTPIVARLK